MVKKNLKKDRFAAREAEKYQDPIASREYIMELLREHGRPISHPSLVRLLNIKKESQQEALQRRLQAMVRDGQLLQNRKGAYGLIKKMQLIKSHISGHKDGFGFAVPEGGGEDVFLNARQMRSVFPDDEVLVRVGAIDEKGRREGFIVEVLERHTHELVGRFFKEGGVGFVEPSNQRIAQDILIGHDDEGGAKSGQIVVVKILEQPTLSTRARGKVIEILGDHMAPGMEIDVAIRNHELPHLWPEAVLKEASQFSKEVPPSEIKKRVDLTHLPFVTIDGEDAKDFDDAVYCEKDAKEGWILYVAIADVSHYVRFGTSLDQEAFNRGNSVYFPGRVIPMLPEVLSNELCSLKPHVHRLTLVCEMHISKSGKIKRYRFAEAVIKSQARLTYTQVNAIITEKDLALQKEFKTLVDPLYELFAIYQVLHAARKKRGAIDFDLPETKIIFGKGRKIERIVALHRNDAHRLIEECMLCANISAALFLIQNKVSGLFRIHEGPPPEKLMDLRKFLNELGLNLQGGDNPSPSHYGKLLEKVAERADAHLIQTVLLRSLSQALYSPDNKGHFGLAYEAYTHFTSPIRRFPDLIVHRLIKETLRHKGGMDALSSQLGKWAEHCSMTERRADDATREAVDWLKCEYMVDKVGETFLGVITNVTHFGFFVELKEVYVEGLVHISMLRNDYYLFDPVKHALLGERTGKRYRLGDNVEVKVARVDLDKREIDFIPADPTEIASPKKFKKKKRF